MSCGTSDAEEVGGGGTQAPGARFASHFGAVNKFTV